MRTRFFQTITALIIAPVVLGFMWQGFWWLLLPFGVVLAIGLYDVSQPKQTLRRNFPFIGRGRWLMEAMRPFVYQYFIESEVNGSPINRMFRSIVYQRAKGDLATNPYGTKLDTYENGYEWISHSIGALNIDDINSKPRVLIGGPDCLKPYNASLLNISAMSFGSLSKNAVMALNGGAKKGNSTRLLTGTMARNAPFKDC